MRNIKARKSGFTLVELLITLAIMALIFVAIGTAFDAAFKNYDINADINAINTAHRNFIHQLSSSLRTAVNDPDDGLITVADGGSELSFTSSSGHQMLYRFDLESGELLVSIDDGDEVVLLENVSQSGVAPIFELEDPPAGSGLDAGTVGKISIRFSSSYKGLSKTVATSVIPRNVIYQ